MDQIPGGVALTIEKEDWLSEIQLENQELLIKTKELEPVDMRFESLHTQKYKGTYQDPLSGSDLRRSMDSTEHKQHANNRLVPESSASAS